MRGAFLSERTKCALIKTKLFSLNLTGS